MDLLKGCKTKQQNATIAGMSLEDFHALEKLASKAPVLKIGSWEEPFEVITDLATWLLAQYWSKTPGQWISTT